MPEALILRLMNEDVLKKVFEHYLQACFIDNGLPPTFQNLLLLTHICKEWRELVSHSPPIWSWFSICILYPNTDYVSLLQLLLQHSGSHPLSFQFYEWHRADVPTVTLSVMRLLLEKRHLWKDIDITLDTYPAVLSNVTEGDFPRLESVSLTTGNGWTSDRRLHLWRALHSSLLIRKVTLNMFCDQIPYLDAISWHNLRSLDIADLYIAPDQIFEILKACNELEFLRFDGCFEFEGFDWQTFHHAAASAAPVILPRLQQMHLTLGQKPVLYMASLPPTIGEEIYSWFFGSISAPALTQLHLWLWERYSSEPFVKFCRVSGCRLQNLKLCYRPGKPRDEDAAEWLRSVTTSSS